VVAVWIEEDRDSRGRGLYYALVDNLSYRLDQNGPFNTVTLPKNVAVSTILGATANPTTLVPGTKVIPSACSQTSRRPL